MVGVGWRAGRDGCAGDGCREFRLSEVKQIRRLHIVNAVLKGCLHRWRKIEEGFANDFLARSKQGGCFEKMVDQTMKALGAVA